MNARRFNERFDAGVCDRRLDLESLLGLMALADALEERERGDEGQREEPVRREVAA